jgi:hypothetical protein
MTIIKPIEIFCRNLSNQSAPEFWRRQLAFALLAQGGKLCLESRATGGQSARP